MVQTSHSREWECISGEKLREKGDEMRRVVSSHVSRPEEEQKKKKKEQNIFQLGQ